MQKNLSIGGVIITPQKTIVLTSQHGNSWSLPKGHINEGENELEAGYREIHEETGISKDKLTLKGALGSYERFRIGKDGGEDTSSIKEIHMYLFTIEKEMPLLPIDPENPEARWVTLEEALKMLTHPKDREFLNSKISAIKSALK